jgi:two-component system chemotaxis sensor kinase CheA
VTDDPMVRMKQDFISDTSDTIEKISHSLADLGANETPSRTQVDWLFRTVHSLKGTSGMFDLHDVSALAASVEDLLELVRSEHMELDAAVLEMLVESFDELALLLQQARGEEVGSSWEKVKSRLDRLTRHASVGPAPDQEADGGSDDREIPADLRMVLSSDELAAVTRHMARGRSVYRVSLEFDTPDGSGHEEALRRVQEEGEIVSVLPPERGTPASGSTISVVYVPREAEADLSGLPAGCRATIESLLAPRPRAMKGPGQHSAGSNNADETVKANQRSPAVLSVKVEIGILDSMMNAVSELYSARLGLLGVARRLPHTDETRRLRDDLLKIGLVLNNRVRALEEVIAGVRLVPVSLLFDRYRGEIRRLARKSGKRVRLEVEGEGTRIDRAMLDNLHDPVLHIIRNAVDHGIELPEERRARGKPETGRITLRARQEANHICVEVADDGRGVNLAKVREKALEKGFAPVSGANTLNLIFEPGLSTRNDVSDISGRGVGLDAARTTIESLKGMITVESSVMNGTCFSVYVPLTLAVSRGVLVHEHGLPCVIPLRSVLEVLGLSSGSALDLRQTGTLMHRGRRIRALLLSELLGFLDGRDAGTAVILGVGDKRRALMAQHVRGEIEVVSRPLPGMIVTPGFIAGATELHDGRPAIIIQPEDLLSETPASHSRGPVSGSGTADWCNRETPGPRRACGALVFRTGRSFYGVCLDMLKEVVPLKHMCDVPVLGRTWQGLFFNRGMCHGLLRLSDGDGTRGTPSVAVLAYPERCGIGMDEVFGSFEIPPEEIQGLPEGEGEGPVRAGGVWKWDEKKVTMLELAVSDRTADTTSTPVSGRTNAVRHP